ncbi:MAG: type II toxin-antitoxin system Phd/YefM family antitoxin [Pyrinomonadaceae bacterium]
MTKTNVHEAKTNLSKLIEQALKGEEVVIAKAGKPLVRLVPVRDEKESCFGMDAGKIWIADDFDDLPDDLLAAFYGENDEGFN